MAVIIKFVYNFLFLNHFVIKYSLVCKLYFKSFTMCANFCFYYGHGVLALICTSVYTHACKTDACSVGRCNLLMLLI